MESGVGPALVDAIATVASFVLVGYVSWQLRQLRALLSRQRWVDEERER